MPRATLTIRVPKDLWIGDITREYPDASFRVLAALPDDDTGVGLVEVSAPDLAAVIREIDAAPEVAQLNLLRRHDDTALVQFETTEPLLLFPIVGSGIPLELPFELSDGTAIWDITTSQDRLSALGDQLEAFNIDYTVEEIHYHLQTEQLLTDRQDALIREAVEAGYYDTPRDCSLTDLADRMGLAKSTTSETLHRAEGKIIKEFLSENEPGR
ncbi:MAG: helix-turn-helix domain-containing protein [Halodesulfurarchaeum sp.]